MISLTEEQVGRLLVGREVKISIGEPWDFSSPDGDNVLEGRIEAVRPIGDLGDQEVHLAVTPFLSEEGRTIDRLVARRRHKVSTGIIEQLAAGGDAEANLSYADQVSEEERLPGRTPKLIGGFGLADYPGGASR